MSAEFDFSDAFEDVGVAATYTPADSKVELFPVQVIPTGGVSAREFQPFGYADENAVFVQNSDLIAAGIESPAVRDGGVDGDTITRPGPAGTNETWVVTGKQYYDLAGIWVLSLEKDLRFRP